MSNTKQEMVTKQAISKFFELIQRSNPSFRPLNNTNVDAYFDVLKDTPLKDFIVAAKRLATSKLYGWPGAGEIYELCNGKHKPIVTEGERLWHKTYNHIINNQGNISRHDEWDKIRDALKFAGSVSQIIGATEYSLERIRERFIRFIDSGAGK